MCFVYLVSLGEREEREERVFRDGGLMRFMRSVKR